jgi:hypothetical protein
MILKAEYIMAITLLVPGGLLLCIFGSPGAELYFNVDKSTGLFK